MCYKCSRRRIESQSSMESSSLKSSKVTKDTSPTKSKPTEKDKTKSKEKSSSKDKDKSKTKEKPSKEKEKEEPKLKEKSPPKDKSVKSKSKIVDLPLPKLKKPSGKVNNHDEVPISGIKGAAKKSWWEMDGCVADVYAKVVDAQTPIDSKPELKEDKSSKKTASSVQSYSENGTCENGTCENGSGESVSKVSSSREREKSSPANVEKDEEIQKRGRTLRGINTRNQDLNETTATNVSYRTANSNLSSISNEENSEPVAKPPPFQFKGAVVRGGALNISGFGSGFKDDKPMPESIFQNRNIPNRQNQEQDDYEEDYEAPQRSSNPPRGPVSRPSAPRFGARCEDNDGFQSNSLPSRPTNVPSGGPVGSGPGLSPRPKFTRPMPLKRGAGAIYARPVSFTPFTYYPQLFIY